MPERNLLDVRNSFSEASLRSVPPDAGRFFYLGALLIEVNSARSARPWPRLSRQSAPSLFG